MFPHQYRFVKIDPIIKNSAFWLVCHSKLDLFSWTNTMRELYCKFWFLNNYQLSLHWQECYMKKMNKRKRLIIRYSSVLSFFPFLENKVFFGQWVQFGFYPWIQTIYHWLRSDFSKQITDSLDSLLNPESSRENNNYSDIEWSFVYWNRPPEWHQLLVTRDYK